MPKAKKKRPVEATIVAVTDNDDFADALDEFLEEWEIEGDVHIVPATDVEDEEPEDDDEDDDDEDDDDEDGEEDEDDEDDEDDDDDEDEDDEDDEPPARRPSKKSSAPVKKAAPRKAPSRGKK